MADLKDIGTAGLKGWRAKVGDGLAGPVSERTPLDADAVRAAVGFLFFALATVYVATTGAEIARRLRG
jgi:hypothetical protein